MYAGAGRTLRSCVWGGAGAFQFLPGGTDSIHCRGSAGVSGRVAHPALSVMEGFSVKIVVVHSPKIIGFFLRKFFHIHKEPVESQH